MGLSPEAASALRRAAAGLPLADAERAALGGLEAALAGPTATFRFDPEPASAGPATLSEGPAAPAPGWSPAEATPDADRFERLGPLGGGGMGEVLRVRDRRLGRELALKVLHPQLRASPAHREAFVAEARVLARLGHPSIVAVHDLGELPDGRLWFLMDLIRGTTMEALIRLVHLGGGRGWTATVQGWSLHRLVSAFHQVCQAVAFAHRRGVVHRDLKPANLMVGEFGEVQVIDWGLAALLEAPPVARERSEMGIAGTPAYMAPEQALGADAGSPRGDVYALGSVLCEVLTGVPPYGHPAADLAGARALLARVQGGPPPPVEAPPHLPGAVGLAGLVRRATARDPAQRFADAAAFADAVRAWLDGRDREGRAQQRVAVARERRGEAAARRAEAAQLRAAAEARLQGVPAWSPATEKAEGWALADRAAALDLEAAEIDDERLWELRVALVEAPGLVDAHAELADEARIELESAEQARDRRRTAAAARALRHHLGALPVGHPARAPGLRWLDGRGALTLDGPAGARVWAAPVAERSRRLAEGPGVVLGELPLQAAPIPAGSWVLRVESDGEQLRLPIFVGRSATVDLRPPGARRPAPLPLGVRCGPDEVLVPPGWSLVGGDPRAPGQPLSARRVWLHAFVVERHPVTHARYMAFLADLIAAGRLDEARARAPRAFGAPLEAAQYTLGPDGVGFGEGLDVRRWTPDTPVALIDWHDARAFAAWQAARDGLPWRLLDELEREKAARGVDGRSFPWGEQVDPSWANMRDSHAGGARPAPISVFPDDQSVYGVRGVAGNVLDWTATPFRPEGWVPDGGALGPGAVDPAAADPASGARRVTRGGSWPDAASSGRCATRYSLDPGMRLNFLGFRLGRSL